MNEKRERRREIDRKSMSKSKSKSRRDGRAIMSFGACLPPSLLNPQGQPSLVQPMYAGELLKIERTTRKSGEKGEMNNQVNDMLLCFWFLSFCLVNVRLRASASVLPCV
jgi:hypothetical protein